MKANRFMPAIAALVILLTAGAFATAARAQEEADAGTLGLARISYMSGEVLFNSTVDDEWAEASPNYPLLSGDRLWVSDDSKLEVRFVTGETAWVNYQSELDMLALSSGNDGNAYQMGLPFGEASFDVKNFEVLGSVFQVDTPNASVRAFGKALFRVTALGDGSTQVGVVRGSVEVETERGLANIHTGELLEVYPEGRSRIMELPEPDGWDDFVASRLGRYDRTYASDRYLPREMHDYSYEFDSGGRWESYPDYGRVWVPTVAVGWSPYSNGRWVWSGWDYVWLPYDPWYAPFHYGRWEWTVSFGWCWVPPPPAAVFWSPGYVGWVWDADYVYWVPLAPREVYYGYGHFGPHSVNIYKTTVIVNKTVYKNAGRRHGVVVVEKNNFLRGKTVRVKDEKVVRKFKEKIVRKEITRERTVREEVSFGAPPAKAIKPIRETRLPKPDKVFKADRLPKKVVERKAFVKERKVVRGKVKSAFEPAQTPRHMKDLERIKKPEFKWDGRDKRREQRIERRDSREQKRDVRQEMREELKQERAGEREEKKELRQEMREDRRQERLDIREQRREDKPSIRERVLSPEDGAVRKQEDRGPAVEDRGGRDKKPGRMEKAKPQETKGKKSRPKQDEGGKKSKDRDKDGRGSPDDERSGQE